MDSHQYSRVLFLGFLMPCKTYFARHWPLYQSTLQCVKSLFFERKSMNKLEKIREIYTKKIKFG